MSDKRPLSELGVKMRDSLPPILRGSHDYLAVVHASAREVELLEASIESVRAQFNPGTADVLLSAWEYQVKLPVGGAGADIATRRRAVIDRLRKLLDQSEGREWMATITGIVGSGWSYREHNPSDPSSPAAGVLDVTLPFALDTPQYTQAVQQIREITPAHLEIVFATADTFQLDLSELDVAEFGT